MIDCGHETKQMLCQQLECFIGCISCFPFHQRSSRESKHSACEFIYINSGILEFMINGTGLIHLIFFFLSLFS